MEYMRCVHKQIGEVGEVGEKDELTHRAVARYPVYTGHALCLMVCPGSCIDFVRPPLV